MYLKGHNQKWFSMKNNVIKHFRTPTGVHLAAVSEENVVETGSESREMKIFKNLVSCALQVVHSKCGGHHYETQLALIKSCGADVGDYGHSR